jgi:hypothetical protein
MPRLTLLAFVLISSIAFAADEGKPKADVPPPGGIKLADGYRHERLQGIDSQVGRFVKEGAAEIHYDIGAMAGNYATGRPAADLVWSMSQLVNGRPVDIVKTKDGNVYVSFALQVKERKGGYPANFYAKVSNDEDLAALLVMALTYADEK